MSVPPPITPFDPVIVRFVELKEWLLGSFGLSNDAMHVHVGLVLFLGMVLAFRGRGGVWLPLLLLTTLSMVAEVFDVLALLSVKSPIDPMESVRDVACTLAWPFILSILLSYWRRRGLPG